MLILLACLLPSLAFGQQVVAPGGNATDSFAMANSNGETIPITASSTTSNLAFTTKTGINAPNVVVSAPPANGQTVFVGCGIGSTTAAVLPGQGSVNAFPIFPGEILTLRKGVGSDTCAAITASSTSTVYFTAVVGQ